MKQVSNQRYLVFLEDVSTMVDWEAVRVYLPDKNNGSCIVVHTRQLEIASLFVGQSHQVSELEQFSADHSVCVFFNENREEDEKAAKTEAARKWLEEFQCVGHQHDLRFLRRVIAGLTYNDVASVFGIAGVGKSSLVKQVYCETVIKRGPFQRFGWVDVFHPFNLRELSRRLLLDLQSGSLQQGSMWRIKDPVQECRGLLDQHRCLIVINGLQSTEEWDSIKASLAGHNNRSSIVVIAQEESVAEYCSKEVWLMVDSLRIDEALDLFKMRVSEKIGHSVLTITVIERANLILHKCGGLPKVIVAVADFMANRLYVDEYWDFLSDGFMDVLEAHPAFGSLQGLFAWVHSYFRSCPDFLKPCIFYLSIFPLNHSIRRRRLVRRWVAEGYSRDTKDVTGAKGYSRSFRGAKESTAEEAAEQYFLKLFTLCMIHVPGQKSLSKYMRMPLCQVNGFFREYIISRSMEENLVFALEGRCSMNAQRTGRHLTIGGTWGRDQIMFETIDFSRLRSLTVFGKWESFFISDKMRLLRVLDLEDVSSGITNCDVEKMVKLLPHLKFLSLRGCRQISRLPDSLDGLRQLQTLDIRHTLVVTLPLSITKLQKLQYIRAGTSIPLDEDTNMVDSPPPPPAAESSSLSTSSMSRPHAALMSRLRLSKLYKHRHFVVSHNGGVEVPRGIGQLMALHTLGVIDVSVASGRAILEELMNLTQLRKLGVSGINRENCQEFCSAISGHRYLESLSLQLDKDENQRCLDGISPPPENLESLKLYGHVEDKLPTWIKMLPNLSKLVLQTTTIPQSETEMLGDLPKLRNLSLHYKEFQDGKLQFHGDFDELRVLEIACNSRLQAVTFENRVMVNLEILKLRCCSVSPSLQFFGLEELSVLKEIWLSGSYDEALKQRLKNQLVEHRRKIKPVVMEEPRSS